MRNFFPPESPVLAADEVVLVPDESAAFPLPESAGDFVQPSSAVKANIIAQGNRLHIAIVSEKRTSILRISNAEHTTRRITEQAAVAKVSRQTAGLRRQDAIRHGMAAPNDVR
jgi:hypothetical protein